MILTESLARLNASLSLFIVNSSMAFPPSPCVVVLRHAPLQMSEQRRTVPRTGRLSWLTRWATIERSNCVKKVMALGAIPPLYRDLRLRFSSRVRFVRLSPFPGLFG